MADLARVLAADTCPATSALADAREVVADLHRIVAPGGVQEAHAAEIGGIPQWLDVRGNERLSYGYGLAQARARAHDDAEALRELASVAPYPGDATITRERIVIARRWARFYGGLSAFREESGYYFDGPLLSPGYTDRDRCAIDAGSLFTLQRVLPEFLEVDFGEVRALEVPVVMFMGRHDYTTPSAPTAAWLERLEAPYKRGVWFERSAHMIPWEEPGRTLVSLVELVRPPATGAPPAH